MIFQCTSLGLLMNIHNPQQFQKFVHMIDQVLTPTLTITSILFGHLGKNAPHISIWHCAHIVGCFNPVLYYNNVPTWQNWGKLHVKLNISIKNWGKLQVKLEFCHVGRLCFGTGDDYSILFTKNFTHHMCQNIPYIIRKETCLESTHYVHIY